MTLKKTFLLFLIACTFTALAQDKVWNADIDKPKEDGTDTVTITTRTVDDPNQVDLVVPVEIKETDTAAEKAKKISDAINNSDDNDGKVTTSSLGDQVSFTGKGDNRIKRIRYNSKSGQKRKKITADTDGTMSDAEPVPVEKTAAQVPVPAPTSLARAYFYGFITGRNNLNGTGTVTMGTAQGSITLNTIDYATLLDLNNALVAGLNSFGINAYLDPSNIIVINPVPADGNSIIFGCDDFGLDVIAEFDL